MTTNDWYTIAVDGMPRVGSHDLRVSPRPIFLIWDGTEQSTACLDDGWRVGEALTWICPAGGYSRFEGVTHWRTLPDPPSRELTEEDL